MVAARVKGNPSPALRAGANRLIQLAKLGHASSQAILNHLAYCIKDPCIICEIYLDGIKKSDASDAVMFAVGMGA